MKPQVAGSATIQINRAPCLCGRDWQFVPDQGRKAENWGSYVYVLFIFYLYIVPFYLLNVAIFHYFIILICYYSSFNYSIVVFHSPNHCLLSLIYIYWMVIIWTVNLFFQGTTVPTINRGHEEGDCLVFRGGEFAVSWMNSWLMFYYTERYVSIIQKHNYDC